MHAADNGTISPEEYFRKEVAAAHKSEYFHGELFAMAGATFNHNLIVANIITLLNGALDAPDCYVLPGDMKVEAAPGGHYIYPDISVVLGDVAFVGERRDVIANPLIIVEVLSPLTREYDRGIKFRACRKLPSIREFLLVEQDIRCVEHYWRDASGLWLLRDVDGANDAVRLQALDVELPLASIYRKVGWQASGI